MKDFQFPADLDAEIAKLLGFEPCHHEGCSSSPDTKDKWHDYGTDATSGPTVVTRDGCWKQYRSGDVRHFHPTTEMAWMVPIMLRLSPQGYTLQMFLTPAMSDRFTVSVGFNDGALEALAVERDAEVAVAFSRALVRCTATKRVIPKYEFDEEDK